MLPKRMIQIHTFNSILSNQTFNFFSRSILSSSKQSFFSFQDPKLLAFQIKIHILFQDRNRNIISRTRNEFRSKTNSFQNQIKGKTSCFTYQHQILSVLQTKLFYNPYFLILDRNSNMIKLTDRKLTMK